MRDRYLLALDQPRVSADARSMWTPSGGRGVLVAPSAVAVALFAGGCHSDPSTSTARQRSAAPTPGASSSAPTRCPRSEPLPQRPHLSWKASSTLICVYAAAGGRPPGRKIIQGDPTRQAFASLRPLGTRSCNANFDTRNVSVIRTGPSGERNAIDFNLSGCMPVTTPAHERLVVAYRFESLIGDLAAQAWKHPQRT
jgi:hypothetical protein